MTEVGRVLLGLGGGLLMLAGFMLARLRRQPGLLGIVLGALSLPGLLLLSLLPAPADPASRGAARGDSRLLSAARDKAPQPGVADSDRV